MAQLRDDWAVSCAVAALGTYGVAAEQVDDRNDVHGTNSMTRVFVYEYISASDPAPSREMLAQGRAMRDAMLADLAAMADVHTTCAAPEREIPTLAAGGLTVCSAAPGEDAVSFVRREAVRHDVVWVVAPETDGVLLSLCESVDPGRWLGCSAAAIALAANKSATAEHLAAQGAATTLPWREPEDDASDKRQRWVVKPQYGAGSDATYCYPDFATAQRAWQARSAMGEAVVMERWVEGDALSVSVLCSPSHHELLSINRQHIRLGDDGRVHYEGVSHTAIDVKSIPGQWMTKMTARVVESMPGLSGFIGIDVVWHPSRGPVVIEVNPRLTSAYVGLSGQLERNFAREMLAAHQVATEMTLLDGAAP